VAGEQVHVFEHHVVAVRDQLARIVERRRLGRGLDEAEVAPAVVDQQVEAARAVVQRQLDAVAPRQHGARRGLRVVGIEHPQAGGVLACGRQHQPAVIARLAQVQPEQFVGFLEHQFVGAILAEPVPPQAVRAPGFVLAEVVERAAVVAPHGAFRLLDRQRQVGAAGQVTHAQRVVERAGFVERVGQQRRIGADFQRAELQEGLAFGELVQVEQHFLLRCGRVAAAQVERVLAARLGAAPLPPAVLAPRYLVVVFLDARKHLGVERVAQPVQRRQPGARVGVLGVQVGQHLGVVDLAQPVPFVDAARNASSA
jgi:hypothetical protein